jgi:uncharacterized protein YktB (UPF0637 family)
MDIQGFQIEDFNVFNIEGLEKRMHAIQDKIQPKFKQIGDILVDDVSAMVGSEMHLHIARHARRTVNPPNDTWLAFAGNKRGYKKHPHFQIGLWDDHLFIWLAFIYELPNKEVIAKKFMEHQERIKALPKDFVISLDHMQKHATPLSEIDLQAALQRFRDVKKAEFLIGKQLSPADPIVQDGNALYHYIKGTYEKLIPLYRLAFQ